MAICKPTAVQCLPLYMVGFRDSVLHRWVVLGQVQGTWATCARITCMLHDLDTLVARLRQLLAHVRALREERAEQQRLLARLQREHVTLSQELEQRVKECCDLHEKLAQRQQLDQEQAQQHAQALAQAQQQAGRAHAQLQQELFQCQGERDQAVVQLQASREQSQRLRSAAQQAHGMIDTWLLRLPGAEQQG